VEHVGVLAAAAGHVEGAGAGGEPVAAGVGGDRGLA
jgi:hypothetical protein